VMRGEPDVRANACSTTGEVFRGSSTGPIMLQAPAMDAPRS
jgi:hypothetical protein